MEYEWNDELPKECPPKDAISPEGINLYRLSDDEKLIDSEFRSQRTMNPTKFFPGISECIARSLSTWDNKESCLKILKLPRFKGKTKYLVEIPLEEKDGLIKQTFKKSHYSWWRSTSFSIASCNVIKE